MSYFETGTRGSAPFRVERGEDLPVVSLAEGITAAPLLGDRLNINVVVIAPGAIAAVHTHDEEQMGYVVRGNVEFGDGERTWVLEPGDVYHAQPGTPHGARAIDSAVVIIDVFSPVRAGMRELLEGS
jgi:unsaturated pyranuronate lyase